MSKLTATLMFATKSAREFPTAKMVRPMMASDRPNMNPNAWKTRGVKIGTCEVNSQWRQLTRRTPTTSSAIAMIQTIATKKPIEQRKMRMVECSPELENMRTRIAAAAPVIAVASNNHSS